MTPHAELHPYAPKTIRKLEPLQPGDNNTESHIVVAPIYTKVYSRTAFMNNCTVNALKTKIKIPKCQPVAGHFVDDSKKEIVTNNFFIVAPPKPAECNIKHCVLRLKESNVKTTGTEPLDPFKERLITVNKEFRTNPDGVRIGVTVIGHSIKYPTVYTANWTTWWQAGIPEACMQISEERNRLPTIINSYEAQLKTKQDQLKQATDYDIKVELNEEIKQLQGIIKENKKKLSNIENNLDQCIRQNRTSAGKPDESKTNSSTTSTCTSVSNQTSLPNETSQTRSAQPPVNKQKTFTITYSGTELSRNDTSIKAATSGSFQLILDNKEVKEDSMNYGKVKGLGYVEIVLMESSNSGPCKYEFHGPYRVYGNESSFSHDSHGWHISFVNQAEFLNK